MSFNKDPEHINAVAQISDMQFTFAFALTMASTAVLALPLQIPSATDLTKLRKELEVALDAAVKFVSNADDTLDDATDQPSKGGDLLAIFPQPDSGKARTQKRGLLDLLPFEEIEVPIGSVLPTNLLDDVGTLSSTTGVKNALETVRLESSNSLDERDTTASTGGLDGSTDAVIGVVANNGRIRGFLDRLTKPPILTPLVEEDGDDDSEEARTEKRGLLRKDRIPSPEILESIHDDVIDASATIDGLLAKVRNKDIGRLTLEPVSDKAKTIKRSLLDGLLAGASTRVPTDTVTDLLDVVPLSLGPATENIFEPVGGLVQGVNDAVGNNLGK